MTFAGNMPENTYARLMKANFERLIDGAVIAAGHRLKPCDTSALNSQSLSVAWEESLSSNSVLKKKWKGARHPGERRHLYRILFLWRDIAFAKGGKCELHNQTMTITSLSER